MQLDGGAFDASMNDSGEHWCIAETEYGELGDLGTPGAPNELCDPCLDVVCDEPPGAACDGETAQTFEATGVCDAGVCIYEALPEVNCSESDQTCVNGACVTPCAYFCELADAICVGGLAIDFGGSDCQDACDEWEVGSPGDDATDTTWCRIGYLAQGVDVVPATACAAATVDGGEICVNPPTTCELYCDLSVCGVISILWPSRRR